MADFYPIWDDASGPKALFNFRVVAKIRGKSIPVETYKHRWLMA
jgi:hypothetical protein